MPIDVRNLDRYGLFNLFWNTHGDPDLSGGGLNEVSARGAEKLHEFAMNHELDGARSAAAQRLISGEEKEIIKALLAHPHYGAFFELDGKTRLMELFGIQANDVDEAEGQKPIKVGDIQLPGRVSQIDPNRLANVHVSSLAELFEREYQQNRGFYEAGNEPAEEKSKKALALLRDYAGALWARGERPETEEAGHALLDAFERTRYGKVLGGDNYNGAPWSVAQSLVLGLDPNAFETSFPEAGSDVAVTYLNMSDSMAKPMRHVDEYRAALGMEKGAEAHELRPPIGFMIGEPNGHNKKGSLDEKRPFSTSGLNWGLVLFPRDAEVRELPPKAGFEFPIDCLDGLGNFLRCDPRYGEQLKVIDKDGNFLGVEKVIHKNAEGKAESWSAKFTDRNGQEVAPDKVLGVFTDRGGRIKGDKRAANSVNMWWWGFCDRNTAQKLYKATYKIPQLDQDTVKVKAGDRAIEIPKAEAQMLLDADVPDIVTGENMSGFRWNDELQVVSLKSGEQIEGRTAGDVLETAPGVKRLSGDMVAVHNDDKRPLLGTIELKMDGDSKETINVKNIKKLEKDPNTGKVTLHLDNGYRDEMTGELASEVPWDRAVEENGKLVLTQDASYPVRGDIVVSLANGESRRIPAKDVNQIVGEMKEDLRLSQFTVWVTLNKGNYATDSSTGEVVSNGMRWTNEVDMDVRHGDSRPDWAPQGELEGIEGPLAREPGDKITWMRGRYKAGGENLSTGYAGWVQTNKHGRILNEGFTSGQPDFGWSANGPLEWKASSSFNPHMVPDLRIAMLVNGVSDLKRDTDKTDELAKRLNLPADWRRYRAE